MLSIKSHLPSSLSLLPWHHKPMTLGSKTQGLLPGTRWTASLSSPNCFAFYTHLIWLQPTWPKNVQAASLNRREFNCKEHIFWSKIDENFQIHSECKKQVNLSGLFQLYTLRNVIDHSLTTQTSKDIKLMRALCILKSFQHYFYYVNVG